ncbi:GrpB family protein [Pelagibius sp. Alg239-R121]|uniref:GrpB family protein n=1 Tax=Pelagibius sp. Alg239-R121 TaxID=2993448 RepID=UPI0024A66E8C|nr:GrpB family protein [Pelagibius sp. Alg239-R121]
MNLKFVNETLAAAVVALTSKITNYDRTWPDMFVAERDRIAGVFGNDLIIIHHVGSTVVPNLAAKPEIDLLVVVVRYLSLPEADPIVRSYDYLQGEQLSLGHRYYRRDVGGVRTHKMHICLTGHWQISRMLRFRDLLRKDPDLREQYQCLKLELEAKTRQEPVSILPAKYHSLTLLSDPNLDHQMTLRTSDPSRSS